ncbi:MAG TPA: alpha/beta hydrolase [Rugosimonospora sp.]|nr:alpha/beta hydrolase [Rugosimonospora sp.]
MNLDPAVREFLDANRINPRQHLSVADQRRYLGLLIDLNFLRFGRPGPPVHAVDTIEIPVEGATVTALVYRPSAEPGLPAHLTLHGGGWWHGSPGDLVNDAVNRRRCVEAGVVVVALDYRLAPEHTFPTGLNDVYAALCHLAEHADELGIDPDNLSIGGSSAGGNLAAAAARMARDLAGPRLVLQLLEVPVLDLTLDTARATAHRIDGQELSGDLTAAVGYYLADPGRAREAYVSPGLAGDLAGLPPALILTGEYDPLSVEGERYAGALDAAGVPARLFCQPGGMHVTSMLTRTWAPAEVWHDLAVAALRNAHGRAPSELVG